MKFFNDNCKNNLLSNYFNNLQEIFESLLGFFSVLKFFKCNLRIFQCQTRNIRHGIECFQHDFIKKFQNLYKNFKTYIG